MAMRTGIPTTAPNATAVGWTIAVGSKTITLGAARGTATGRSASAPWCFASCGVCRGEAMYVPAASASKIKSMVVRWLHFAQSVPTDFKPLECDGEICRTKAGSTAIPAGADCARAACAFAKFAKCVTLRYV